METKANKKPKLHIKKGDTVKVLSGDDKGKTGKVLEVLTLKGRVIVEGINIVTKHEKPSAGKPEGGIKKTEASINISNLMLVDPASGKATRVGRKLNEKGKLQRYSKKTGEFIK
jgi:large subunit ribosomal protein L24